MSKTIEILDAIDDAANHQACFTIQRLTKELRALLAEPKLCDCNQGRLPCTCKEVPPLIQTLHANGDLIAMESTIAQQAQRIADLEAAPVVERQAEPVYQSCNGVDGWIDVDLLRYTARSLHPEEYETRVLFTSPPAPVAVVRYKTYITQPAESLAGMAARQLKDEKRWIEIRDANSLEFPDMCASDYYPAGSAILIPVTACLDKVKELSQ